MANKIYIDTNFDSPNVLEELGKLFSSEQVEFVDTLTQITDLKIRLHEYTEKVAQKFGIISFYTKDPKIQKFVEDSNAIVAHKYDFLEFDDYYEDVDIFYILGKNENPFALEEFANAISGYLGVEVQQYSITYNLDGGTNDPSNPTTYTALEKIVLKDASKEGFVFDGWYETADFSGNTVTSIPAGSAEDKTFYAKFTAESE